LESLIGVQITFFVILGLQRDSTGCHQKDCIIQWEIKPGILVAAGLPKLPIQMKYQEIEDSTWTRARGIAPPFVNA
jgi:hypothetical protein